MTLLINYFSARLSPSEADFLTVPIAEAPQRREQKRDLVDKGCEPVYEKIQGKPAYILLNEVDAVGDRKRIRVLDHRRLSKVLAAKSIQLAARAAGRNVQNARFYSFDILGAPVQVVDDAVSASSGINCHIWHDSESKTIGLVANWCVRMQITADLSDARLRDVAVGERAVFTNGGAMAGLVEKIDGSHAVVHKRGLAPRHIGLQELTLEPRLDLIERVFTGSNVFRRSAELGWQLTSDGRRNSRALPDQLAATQNFIEDTFDNRESRSASSLGAFRISITTNPMRVADV